MLTLKYLLESMKLAALRDRGTFKSLKEPLDKKGSNDSKGTERTKKVPHIITDTETGERRLYIPD